MPSASAAHRRDCSEAAHKEDKFSGYDWTPSDSCLGPPGVGRKATRISAALAPPISHPVTLRALYLAPWNMWSASDLFLGLPDPGGGKGLLGKKKRSIIDTVTLHHRHSNSP